jgi:membrane protein
MASRPGFRHHRAGVGALTQPRPGRSGERAGAKPQSLTQLSGRDWRDTAKRAFKEFRADEMTDRAAALTYYGVLALFPALLVVVALLGIFGQYPQTVNALLDIARQVAPGTAVDNIEKPITEVVQNKGGAGALLGVGLIGAIWSASGYVGAFTRAMNHVYERGEGRPFWKLRPQQLAITIMLLVGLAVLGIGLVVSGSVAEAIGNVIGLGSTAVTVWDIAKWPVMLVILMAIVAGLYYLTPNVQHPKFRWITPGGILAIITWILASVLFAVYVSNFGSYNKTYGSLGAVILFLTWLWITNLTLLFGAEFDAELERTRELKAGERGAERRIQLPPRDEPKDPDATC